jgi:hypothetical protein
VCALQVGSLIICSVEVEKAVIAPERYRDMLACSGTHADARCHLTKGAGGKEAKD